MEGGGGEQNHQKRANSKIPEISGHYRSYRSPLTSILYTEFGASGTWWADTQCMVEVMSILTRIHLVVKDKMVRKLVLDPHGQKQRTMKKKKVLRLLLSFIIIQAGISLFISKGKEKYVMTFSWEDEKIRVSIWFLTVWLSSELQNMFTLRT